MYLNDEFIYVTDRAFVLFEYILFFKICKCSVTVYFTYNPKMMMSSMESLVFETG